MIDKLKKCPFCGGHIQFYDDPFMYRCTKCGVFVIFPSLETAQEQWNNRSEEYCICQTEYEDGPFFVNEYNLSCGHSLKIYAGNKPQYCYHCGKKIIYE